MEIKITKTTNPKPIPQDESTLGFGLKFTDHMFLMDWDEGQGWHDARIVPYGPLEIDPASTVFTMHLRSSRDSRLIELQKARSNFSDPLRMQRE